MKANHSNYDSAMKKSANDTNRFAKSSKSLTSSIALIDGPLGGIASRATNLKTIFTSGAGALGLFAVGLSAVGFGGVKVLKVMSDVEVEMGKTEAILKATGGASGFLSSELDDMARGAARATLASTTDVRQAINSLLTFKSVGSDSFEHVISLSQDMASIWGGSASTNARKLGKALDDPVKQLSRLETAVGAFNPKAREQILLLAETGKKAQAQALILKTLEGRIGGTSEGAGQGLAGAVDLLGQEWDELYEAIDSTTGLSGKVTNFLNGMADSFRGIAESMNPDDLMQLADLQIEHLSKANALARTKNSFGVNPFVIKQEERELALIAAKIKLIQKRIGQSEKESKLAKDKASTLTQERKDAEDLTEIEKLWTAGRKSFYDIAKEGAKEDKKAREQTLAATLSQSEAEDKYYTKLSTDFNSIRTEGLSLLQQENELHSSNIEKIKEYVSIYGQSSISNIATRAESVRHLSASNDAVYDTGGLSNSLGDASKSDNLDLERGEHLSRMAIINEFREQDAANEKAANKASEDEVKRHEKQVTEIKKQEQQSRNLAISTFSGAASTLMSASSKKLFNIGKVAAISTAAVNTALGVTQAWALGPIVGPPLAAMVAAAGLVQIQNIKSQKFGGGANVSTSDTTTSVDSISTDVGEVEDTRQAVQVVFNGPVSGIDAEHIATILKEHLDSTDFVLIEAASRNGQELAA